MFMKWIQVSAALVMSVFYLSPATHAQQGIEAILAQVDACDVLAAHPDDPLRVAPGVPEDELVPRLAAEACEAALKTSDDIGRHAFQLGRAMLALDQRDKAVSLFKQAADSGSSIAMIFLGDAEQFGWNGERNPIKALSYYTTARKMGLLIADIAVAQVTFDASMFTVGPMLRVLADQDIDTAVRFARSELAPPYLYAFATELSVRCGAFLQPKAVSALQSYRFPDGWSAESEQTDPAFGRQDVYATYDVEVLVDRHGCEGSVIETIGASFNMLMTQLASEE